MISRKRKICELLGPEPKKLKVATFENEEEIKSQSLLIWDAITSLNSLNSKAINKLLSYNDQFLGYVNHEEVCNYFLFCNSFNSNK
jgi:hypothetical protein